MDSDAISKQPSGASEKSSLRFNVNQVHLDPNEADEKEDHSPRMDFPEPESPGCPLSVHDATSTIGYATHDAVPMTVFYRNENSNSNPTKKSRPTLRELRKGFEEDHEQQPLEVPHDVENIENGGVGSDEIVIQPKKDKKAKVAPKFGWIKGVMLRCLLNIWGVMLYLRLTWVGGQAGIGWSTVIIILSAVVTWLTTLSMSAVCTNGEVKGGGAYYLISRSLGPEFGGSIGLIFSVANAVAVALYVVGFAETVKDLIKEHGGGVEVIGELNIIRIVGIGTVILLLCVTLVGLEWVVRTQMFLLCILLVSIVDVVIGTFIGPLNEKSEARGFVGLSLNLFKDNFGPAYREGENFFSVFAVFFPAATGILAGVNISGDLKDAQKGIPKGTLWAIIISTIVYIALDWLALACVLRDASGIIAFANQTIANVTSAPPQHCSVDFSCEYGLMNDYQVMEKIAAWGPIVTGGIFAATLSSALASLVGAPKTFQALCKDNIFPGMHYFGVGVGPGDEPRRGYILTFLIAGAFIAIGELNVIAPVISNFFLMSYALINYAVFAASLGKSPGWRPSFKWYNMWVSLVGALVCVVIMFLINWWAALVTIVIIIALYKYVDYKKPEVNWGSSAQAYTYIRALRFTYRLNAVEDHVKNFRPQCLVLTGSPSSRPDLVHLVSQITRNTGLMVCGQVKIGPFGTVSGYEDLWLKQRKIRAFHTICSAPSFREGVRIMLQTVGLGKLKPNTLVLGFKRDWKMLWKDPSGRGVVEEYVNVVHDAFELDYGVAILRLRGELDLQELSKYQVEDWLAMADDDEAPIEHIMSGTNFNERTEDTEFGSSEVQSTEKPSTPSPDKEDHVIRWFRTKSPSHEEEYQLDALKEKTTELNNGENLGSSETENLVDAQEKAEVSSTKHEQQSPQVVKKGKFKVTVSKMPGEDEGSEGKVDETTKLTDPVEPQKPPSETEIAFKEKQKGTIDVWWFRDDGGLTILIPYLLSIHNYWKGCKLRIFTPASTHKLQSNELRMANLLKRFRIDFSSIVEVEGINKAPSSQSIQTFMKLPIKDEFTDLSTLEKDRRTMRNIRLGELIREHSNDAKLIVLTLPVPKVEMMSPLLYMSWVEVLSAASPPVLMVRGNQQSVLTFYS